MIALLFILGIFLEIIHFFHPYRVFELLDIVANTLGILAGLGSNFLLKILILKFLSLNSFLVYNCFFWEKLNEI